MPRPIECSFRTSSHDKFVSSAKKISEILKNLISADQEFTQELFEELVRKVANKRDLPITPVWNGQSRERGPSDLQSVHEELQIEDAAGSTFLIFIKANLEGQYFVIAKFAQSDACPVFPDTRGLSFHLRNQ